jgi:hypothetical protein
MRWIGQAAMGEGVGHEQVAKFIVDSGRRHGKQGQGKQASAYDREEKNETCQDTALGKFCERLFDAVIGNSPAFGKQEEYAQGDHCSYGNARNG